MIKDRADIFIAIFQMRIIYRIYIYQKNGEASANLYLFADRGEFFFCLNCTLVSIVGLRSYIVYGVWCICEFHISF